MYDFMLENEFFDELNNNVEFVDEGTTFEVLKTAFTDDFKETKELIKVAQGYFNEGKYDDAIKEAQKVKKLYKQITDRLTGLKDSIISNITGFWSIWVHIYASNFALCSTSMLHKLKIDPEIRTKVIKNKERLNKYSIDLKNVYLRKGDYKTWNNTKQLTIQTLHLLSYEADDFITICNEYKKIKTESTLFESVFNML